MRAGSPSATIRSASSVVSSLGLGCRDSAMYPTALSLARSADPLLDSGLVALRTSGSCLSAATVSSIGFL